MADYTLSAYDQSRRCGTAAGMRTMQVRLAADETRWHMIRFQLMTKAYDQSRRCGTAAGMRTVQVRLAADQPADKSYTLSIWMRDTSAGVHTMQDEVLGC
jgi:hypothetical protein